MKRLCVFCGSSPGRKPEYLQAARELGRILASRNLALVYGGANIGVMGAIADAVLADGGEVIGVIPQGLVEKEIGHSRLSDLRIVHSMHERKSLMFELSDAFIALPGGLGTIEEFFEVLTWTQLGMHQKPCGLLNVCGYYDKMVEFLDHAVEERFIQPAHRTMALIDENPESLLNQLDAYRAPSVKKWLDLKQVCFK